MFYFRSCFPLLKIKKRFTKVYVWLTKIAVFRFFWFLSTSMLTKANPNKKQYRTFASKDLPNEWYWNSEFELPLGRKNIFGNYLSKNRRAEYLVRFAHLRGLRPCQNFASLVLTSSRSVNKRMDYRLIHTGDRTNPPATKLKEQGGHKGANPILKTS